jgi:DNA-binding MarR family transcriptional regulator
MPRAPAPRRRPPRRAPAVAAAETPAAPDAAASLEAFRRIVRVLRVSVRSVEERTGLRAPQLFTLRLVAGEPGLSISELARRTLTDRTSAASMVERLLARGLVERRVGAADRRRIEIFVTPRGAAVLARAPRAPTQRMLDGLAAMGERDLRRLALGLGALVRAMGIAGEPAPMLFGDSGRGPAR